MNLKQMVKNVRGIVEQPGLGYWTVSDFVDSINESTHYMEAIMKDARKEGYFGTWIDGTFSKTGGYMELPPYVQHIQGVQLLDVAGKPFAKKAIFEEGVVRALDAADAIGGGPTGFIYDTWGRKLFLSPATGGNIRVYYVRDSVDMIMGTTTTLAASVSQIPFVGVDNDNTGASAAELEDGIYNGFYAQIISGTVADDGKRVFIDSYVATGRIANITPSLSAAAPIGTEYAFIPRVPQQAHRIICLHAGVGLRMQKDEPYQHLHEHFKEQLDQFVSSIEDFIQEPEEVEPHDSEFGYLS
jgi:hypothetical protein